MRVAANAVLAALATLAAWQALIFATKVPPYLLPSPAAVWQAAVDLRPVLGGHVIATTTVAVAGLAGAAVGGAVLGAGFAALPVVHQAVYPVFVGLQTVPTVALAPLVVAWLGFGTLPKVLVVAVAGGFPVVVSTLEGVTRLDRDAVRLVAALGGSRWQRTWHLLLPGAAPSYLSGVRLAAAYAMVSTVVAEWMGTQQGLGLLLLRSQASFRVDQMLVAVALIAFVSLMLFGAVRVVARFLTPWSVTTAPT